MGYRTSAEIAPLVDDEKLLKEKMMVQTPVEFDEEDPLSHIAGLPASIVLPFDPDVWEEIEWARGTGINAATSRPTDVEGATFVNLGEDCWIIGMKGAQFLHSDRHLAHEMPEQMGHTWNAVIEVDGDQMLLVQDSRYGFTHHPLTVGSLIYFNTYQPHLVSRSDPRDLCVIVQVGGIGPEDPERAIAAMRSAIERRTPVKKRIAA